MNKTFRENANEPKGFRPGVITEISARPASLVEFVASALTQAPSDLSALDLIELGAVYVNDERSLNSARQIRIGDRIRIHSTPRRYFRPSDLDRRVLAEDGETLLIEKPAGLPLDASIDNARENLLAFLEDSRGQNLFLTHRLAADSDGPVLLAKTLAQAERLKRAFADGKIKRVYAAYVENPLPVGDICLGIRVLACEERRARTCLISEGRALWSAEGEELSVLYRLEIEFENARPKDVRARLASLGAPIIGDRAHGSLRALVDSERRSSLAFRAISMRVN